MNKTGFLLSQRSITQAQTNRDTKWDIDRDRSVDRTKTRKQFGIWTGTRT
jgi:hypothetical protein